MAWHILHGLLEQVRVQSTFPGKLWIIVMFIFRIVVVARIGDNVYHDEQSSFICNTLTPGCTNVCFNRFSPISQLRFWSLMVLVVSTPAILFFLYATHVVYHATIKYPFDEEEEEKKRASASPATSVTSYLHPPSMKRRRDSSSIVCNGNGPPKPLYEVTKIANSDGRYKTTKMSKAVRRRRNARNNRDDVDGKMIDKGHKGSVTDNNYESAEEVFDYRGKYPVYVDAQGRKVEFFKDEKQPRAEAEAIAARKFNKKMLEHPELFRAYWWHVFMRTAFEILFLFGQYFLYGWSVSELFECPFDPCPKTVDCYVSRPQEKTCLLWLMYGLGFIACALSLAEFWTMGFTKLKYAFLCCGRGETREERKRRLARLEYCQEKKAHGDAHVKRVTSVVSLDSLSSETTVESV